ncbi:lipopolysaccharide biosynthesis-related membrane protein [Caballeronia hypogeia]|uniref:Lipopolysaccharide biosynthesis-related membrane protein n=1 Tax=Caballeronia hypogeia TaxID=1777140 RepID=A0A158A2G1_9BURK|nr:acyltransferase [Caballeronia hypogeia]SAK52024.1 lipopolysaccharide biosynthesis-related membrane protein [Caballeronia hypogeia]
MSDSSVFAASSVHQSSAVVDDKDVAINAWRGIAALLVAYFHCRQVTWIGMQQFHRMSPTLDANTIISYLTFPIAWGSAGVPIFFVISGYCIHRAMARKLIADPLAPLDAGNFILRRFARIYPVLLAALLLTLALDSLSSTFVPVSHKINPFDPHAFIVNLFSLQGIAGKTFGSNGALWTLSIEVQFYLVYPLLIALRRRIGMRGVLVCVGLVNIVSALLLERHQIVVFTSYWFAWTIGAWIAEAKAQGIHARPRMGLIAAGIALAGCAAFSAAQFAAFQLWAIAFAVYLFSALDTPLRDSFAVRGLSWIGEFSFSLYVVHLPIFVLLGSVLFRSALQTQIWASFGFTAVAVAVAFGFYFMVERPAMRWSAALKRSRR